MSNAEWTLSALGAGYLLWGYIMLRLYASKRLAELDRETNLSPLRSLLVRIIMILIWPAVYWKAYRMR